MSDPKALAFEPHNHSSCVADTLAQVEESCRTKDLRLTPIRKRVLEILLEEHKAMGAYDILDRLRNENRNAQPPVAYRALDFLVSNGFAHKLQRLNAFIACGHPDDQHTPVFMICNTCNSVAEADMGQDHTAIDHAARALGFKIENKLIEAEGLCPKCQDEAAKT